MDSAEHNIFIGTESGKIHQVNLCQKPPESSVSYSALGTGNSTSSTFTGHRYEDFNTVYTVSPDTVLLYFSNAVSCLRVSFDGSLLVSGSVDQTVRTWDIQSSQCLQTLVHKGPVTNILLAIIPRGLTNVASKPTLAIKPFQRTFSKEKAEHNDVSIRIQTRNEDDRGREKHLAGEILELAQQKKDVTKTAAQVESELRAEIKSLKRINKELYEFKVDRVLKR